jgi:hypothetical protein
MNAADAELPMEFLQPRAQPSELRRDFRKRQFLLATDTGSRSTSPPQKRVFTRGPAGWHVVMQRAVLTFGARRSCTSSGWRDGRSVRTPFVAMMEVADLRDRHDGDRRSRSMSSGLQAVGQRREAASTDSRVSSRKAVLGYAKA